MLAGHFINRCDFFVLPHRIFYCSFKSGWEWCGLSVILLYCQVDKMLKIMIELSSTYEYFQRAHTHLRTHARAYRTTHQMQTCAAFMHNAQTCKELSVSRHELRNSSENAFKCKCNAYCPQIERRWYLSHIWGDWNDVHLRFQPITSLTSGLGERILRMSLFTHL